MDSKALHGGRTVAAEGASLDEVMLTDVFVLEVGAHRDLALETAVTYRAMVRQALRVCGEVFSEMILPEESFLADAAFVRFDTGVAHFVAAHVRAVGELHVAHVAFEEFPVWAVGVLRRRHVVVVGRALRHVRGQRAAA